MNPHADRDRRPTLLDDRGWLRAAYVNERQSLQSIADETGTTAETVRRTLLRHGIELRTSRPNQIEFDSDWLRQRFEIDQAPLSVIAAEASVVPRTIVSAVRRLGLADDLGDRQEFVTSRGS